jgi:hypothetical protein
VRVAYSWQCRYIVKLYINLCGVAAADEVPGMPAGPAGALRLPGHLSQAFEDGLTLLCVVVLTKAGLHRIKCGFARQRRKDEQE